MTAEQFDIIRAIIKSAYPSFNIMKAFMKKGKDSDMEVVFECEDTF